MAATESDVYGIVLGRVVAELRRRVGLSQGDLAARLGVAQSTLSRIEAGHIVPDAFTLRRIAAELRMTPEELNATIERAMRRTRSASEGATGQASGKGSWWETALLVAGVAGLAALAGFAVAAVLNEMQDDKKR